MKANLARRVFNTRLPITKTLLPLMECVVNAIHAIDETNRSDGKIVVTVHRDTSQLALLSDSNKTAPITGFSVQDNGIGFNQKNYSSFMETDSDYKSALGGKGIGRLVWLKAFSTAFIESVFQENGKYFKRTFKFSCTAEGISSEKIQEISPTEIHTVIRLDGFNEKYQQACPKTIETISSKVLSHFLIYFIYNQAPNIIVKDEIDGLGISLNDKYKDEIAATVSKSKISVGGQKFDLNLVKRKELTGNTHEVCLCADQREVHSENLANILPSLPPRLKDGEEEFTLLLYVSGKYLDTHVNAERTELYFQQEESLELGDELSKKDLYSALNDSLKSSLKDYLVAINEKKQSAISDFVFNKAPQYRPLLKATYADRVNAISYQALQEENKLDLELHKIFRDVEIELRTKSFEVKKAVPKSDKDYKELNDKYNKLIEEENEIGKANLSKYISHRRTILDLFERKLNLQSNEKYALEEAVHRLICPLGITSDDHAWLENQNLWLIDDRLAYHLHLSSDKPISSNPVMESKSNKEPDLLIFNGPLAFSETLNNFSSAVVIEFKRPGREHYKKGEDPFDQTLRYVEELKSGQAKDRGGKLIRNSAVPFYVYVICDLVEQVEWAAKKLQLSISADGQGFYGYVREFGCHIEVISFTKLLDDAKKRNRILFEKLNLPSF